MPSVQIKDVPDHTHAVLRERAARAHQSLQEYLLAELVDEAATPDLDEVLDRVATRTGGRRDRLGAPARAALQYGASSGR